MTSSHADACLQREQQYLAHNYHPLPVVLSRGEGVYVYDVDGNRYLDFLAGYSAVNQGHRHPRLIAAALEQLERLTLCARAFHNDRLGEFAEQACHLFGYQRLLPMNTGAEAVETAIKLARKWAYVRKGIHAPEARIVVCDHCFHGRTTTIISFSSDPEAHDGFGPYTPGFIRIPFNDVEALRQALEQETRIAAFLVEPIQGEAGVIVPDEGYLQQVARLCQQYDVLLLADEVQTGLGRAGDLLACQHEQVRPDVLILGKALSGGILPVSAVLADADIMDCIGPNQHGSTFGGNPLAAHVGCAALSVTVDEDLPGRARHLGQYFREGLQALASPRIAAIRGRGLMNAIDVHVHQGSNAWDLCLQLAAQGLLTKPVHDNTLRLTPPLVITQAQLDTSLQILGRVLA